MSYNETAITRSPALTPESEPLPTTFPAAKIAAVLYDELVSAVTAEAELLEVLLPEESGDIAKMSFDVDSLLAIEILLAVEEIVGIELPSSVVKAGGYGSVDSAIKTLLPNIEKQWQKHNGEAT